MEEFVDVLPFSTGSVSALLSFLDDAVLQTAIGLLVLLLVERCLHLCRLVVGHLSRAIAESRPVRHFLQRRALRRDLRNIALAADAWYAEMDNPASGKHTQDDLFVWSPHHIYLETQGGNEKSTATETETEMKRHPSRRESGFTLIELLASLVVIGILAAIAISIYSSQKRQAQDAVTRADVATIARAVDDWYIDNSNAQLHRGSYISENVHNLAIHTDKPGSTSFPGTSSTGKETLLTNFALPKVSDGTRWALKAKPLSTYGTTTNTAPGADPTQWTFTPGEEYRWCIVAANSAGNYNFDNGGNFSKMLFWDSTQPGVKTRAELPADGACKQYR